MFHSVDVHFSSRRVHLFHAPHLNQARIVMCDTVVETLGGMDKREKTDFILEQVSDRALRIMSLYMYMQTSCRIV